MALQSSSERLRAGWGQFEREGSTVAHMRRHLERENFIVPPLPEPGRPGVAEYVFGVVGLALVAAVCVAWLVL
jgi:hypothetical protein